MATEPTLFESLGLSSLDDAALARAQTRQRFEDIMRQGQIPWPSKLEEPSRPSLGQCTGFPTYADIFGTTPCFQEWAQEHYPASESDEEPEDDDWDFPWWAVGAGYVAKKLWEKLDTPISFDLPELEYEFDALEIDGIPWTVDVLHEPGPPYAARVGEMLAHGNEALPGPGSKDVLIGGKPALRVVDAVAVCQLTTTLGIQHAPQQTWTTSNTSVKVNGELLLRQGDWVLESPGGPNPLTGGMPTVLAGPPATPVMVQERTYKGLDLFVDDLERVGWKGGKISLKGSVSWTYKDVVKGLGVIALFETGNPVAAWGAREILATMNNPLSNVAIDIDGGTLFGDYRTDYETWTPSGMKHRISRERYEFDVPGFSHERADAIDPSTGKTKKKDEKSETKTTPVDEDTVHIDEDEISIGPFHKKTQRHDADEAPKDWDEK